MWNARKRALVIFCDSSGSFQYKIVSVQIDFLIPGRQTFKKLDEERQSGRSRCLLNDDNGFLQLPPFLAAAVSLNR